PFDPARWLPSAPVILAAPPILSSGADRVGVIGAIDVGQQALRIDGRALDVLAAGHRHRKLLVAHPGLDRHLDVGSAAIVKRHLSVDGIAIRSKLTTVTCAPLAGSLSTYFTPVTARSSFQLFANQPRQNQERSSPAALSMVRKKSDGEGCLNAQSCVYWVNAASKRSGPRIASRSSVRP